MLPRLRAPGRELRRLDLRSRTPGFVGMGALFAMGCVSACGGGGKSGFGGNGLDGGADDVTATADARGLHLVKDGGPAADGTGSCTGIACNVPSCGGRS